jgi:asparaginyl-tRNA synthetase
MDRVTVDRLHQHVGEEVSLKGWVYNLRSSGKIHFLLVRDGTGIVQCVASKADVGEETFELVDRLTQETSLEVIGTVREDRRAPGGVELVLSEVKVIAWSYDYPITPKEHGTSFLLDHRHLWLRSRKQQVIMRVRHHTIRAIRDFLDERGFLCLDAPIFTPNACEGTTTLFETDYFGDKAYLTQSGQLYNEATAAAFGRVYCFGPAFRAEKSKTRRHLTEFWMVEPEVAFATLEEIMDLVEELFEAIVVRVLETCGRQLQEILERDIAKLEAVKRPFPRIGYDEALKILEERGMKVPWGEDFGGDEETVLSEAFDKPVLVHRYPTAVKAFYMQPDPEDPKLCKCVDMLAPEGYGEVVGGGERIWDLELLERRIEEHGLPKKAFEWYCDLRRYGSFPHAGFGLGLERTVAYLCGLKHLREAIPFPRMLNRLSP